MHNYNYLEENESVSEKIYKKEFTRYYKPLI